MPNESTLIDTAGFPFLGDLKSVNPENVALLLTRAMSATHLTKELLIERLHLLAQAEHNRWNAFYILNNYRYGSEKDERKRTHGCLLNWNDLTNNEYDVLKSQKYEN